MRSDLPSGTVTFLFTDVEGSTQLLHELGAEAYDGALMQHRRALREACGRHGGVEVDTQGDAFFYAFPTAQGAVEAASEGQQALGAGPITVRMGLHTGTPHLGNEGYIGDDVHLGARIAASAHGGQVVLSRETRSFVDGDITDLGEHRLKDIPEAVSIFQLGNGSFPPLKTISNTNLPTPPSSFVGRDDELLEVLSRFEDGARLVTLTGPGGTGKTRLAIEAAASLVPDYKAGVFWVGLATLRDPDLVTVTIAQTLGAKDGLAEHIAERELLLLLDNLEQVIDAAPELSDLLMSCPNLTLLCTSRERLRISGEVEYAVPPLAESEAVELFCARSQLESDETITELCRRLDDMPLAVELAAARTKALSPVQILDRISQRLDLLKGGRDADPRQQTLRATIEWSYELLTSEEQRLFARLSVFAGGCTVEAAEEVTDADLDALQSLVEKSLLRFTDGRYWMLETIREYAGEQLETVERAVEVREKHAAWVEALALEASGELRGERQLESLDRLTVEHANISAALAFAVDAGDARRALAISGSLGRYWEFRNHQVEGRRWLEGALELPQPVHDESRWRALYWNIIVADSLGDTSAGLTLSESALDLARKLKDSDAISASALELARRREIGEDDHLDELLEEAGRLGGDHYRANVSYTRGHVSLVQGDPASAVAYLEAALAASRSSGDAQSIAMCLAFVAIAHARLGNQEESRAYLRGSLERFRDLGYAWGVAVCLQGAAELAMLDDDSGEAAKLMIGSDGLLDSLRLAPPSGVEGQLYRQTWNAVRRRVGESKLDIPRIDIPLGDVDHAIQLALESID
jgi:predicted ATPase